jgi:glutamyl-tRNA synthetase
MEDLRMLNITGDAVSWTSDHFDRMYQYALQLIKSGDAYVDDTPVEQMRDERREGIPSKNRKLSVEENLKLFEEMKNGSGRVSPIIFLLESLTSKGLTCCLRAKISVDAKNKALRDPTIYRCNLEPHNRTGSTWKMYPTYDFACPIVDSIEGVRDTCNTFAPLLTFV